MSNLETQGEVIAQPQLAKVFIGRRPGGLLVIDFGQSVSAIELTVDQADLLARTIMKQVLLVKVGR